MERPRPSSNSKSAKKRRHQEMSQDHTSEQVSVLSLNLAVCHVMVPFVTRDWTASDKKSDRLSRLAQSGLEQILTFLCELKDVHLNEQQTTSYIEVVQYVHSFTKNKGEIKT